VIAKHCRPWPTLTVRTANTDNVWVNFMFYPRGSLSPGQRSLSWGTRAAHLDRGFSSTSLERIGCRANTRCPT
jgi:hypothetical protein